MDQKQIIRHENLTPNQVIEFLPDIIFKRLKGRILNAIETHLDSSDPRFIALRNEICLHLSDITNYVSHQLYRMAQEIGIEVDLAEKDTGGK